MRRSCVRMFSMFSWVHTAGWTPLSMAAFSAGSPKASQPIGCNTLKPRIHLKRASRSPMAYTRTCPMWMRPEGYGNISRQ